MTEGRNTIPVVRFSCDALTVDDYNEIATVKKMGDMERKVYIRFMLQWKNGNECDGKYASQLADRVIDGIRNGYFGHFDKAWMFILLNIILDEYKRIIEEV